MDMGAISYSIKISDDIALRDALPDRNQNVVKLGYAVSLNSRERLKRIFNIIS